MTPMPPLTEADAAEAATADEVAIDEVAIDEVGMEVEMEVAAAAGMEVVAAEALAQAETKTVDQAVTAHKAKAQAKVERAAIKTAAGIGTENAVEVKASPKVAVTPPTMTDHG